MQGPTEEDQVKLRQLLGYLLKTRKRVLVLQPKQNFKVTAYIDASLQSIMMGNHIQVL